MDKKTRNWLIAGGVAVAALATLGIVEEIKLSKKVAGTVPVTPSTPATSLPTTGSVWSALTPAQQTTLTQALWNLTANATGCPTSGNDTTQGMTSYADLSTVVNGGMPNLTAAVNCFQESTNAAITGVLDASTYKAILAAAGQV
jgi:hypothetical protein